MALLTFQHGKVFPDFRGVNSAEEALTNLLSALQQRNGELERHFALLTSERENEEVTLI